MDPSQEAAKADATRTASTLQEILQAYRGAVAEGADESKREALEVALKGAFAKAEETRAFEESAAAKLRAEMEVENDRKRKEAEEEGGEHLSTQLGDSDLGEADLEALLLKIPATKRQRALDRLTQLGMADA